MSLRRPKPPIKGGSAPEEEDIFIDLLEFVLHVSGEKLAHLQEHF